MKKTTIVLILMLSVTVMPDKAVTASEREAVGSAPSAVADIEADISELPPIPEQKEAAKMKYLVKKLQVPHCKRGPERCDICRKAGDPRWCLLDVDPPDKEIVQRPVLDLTIGGERYILVYDVIKSFDSEEEAHQFISESDYSDVIYDR